MDLELGASRPRARVPTIITIVTWPQESYRTCMATWPAWAGGSHTQGGQLLLASPYALSGCFFILYLTTVRNGHRGRGLTGQTPGSVWAHYLTRLLLMCTVEGIKGLGLCHPPGRPSLSSGSMACAWASPSHRGHPKGKQLMGSVYLCLSNEQKKQRDKERSRRLQSSSAPC